MLNPDSKDDFIDTQKIDCNWKTMKRRYFRTNRSDLGFCTGCIFYIEQYKVQHYLRLPSLTSYRARSINKLDGHTSSLCSIAISKECLNEELQTKKLQEISEQEAIMQIL